ncbi:MAG: ABC transporter ATP-binding protein [Patescibacteria group bacterium]
MAKRFIDTTDGQHYSARDLIRDLFVFLSPYRGRLIAASLFRLAGDLAWLYPAYALAAVTTFLTNYQPGDSLMPAWYLIAGWGVASIIRNGGQYGARLIGFAAAERASLDAQERSLEHLFDLENSWHEKENSGNKLKRVEKGAEAINFMVRIWINNLIEICVNLVGVVVILATVDRFISLVTVAFIISFYLISVPLLRKASNAAKAVNAKEEDLNGLLFEGINNVRTVKVLSISDGLLANVKASAREVFSKVRQRIFWFQTRNHFLGLWTNAFRVVVFAFIAFQITQGHFEVGFLILFHMYFNRVYEAVGELSDVVQDLIVSKYSIGRMMSILSLPVHKEGKGGKKEFPENWKKISLKNVSFSYGEHEVLKNVSFDIRRGERVGVIGLSGAGKSTLFKLLLKENEEYTGEILIDELPLRKIKKHSYYKSATVVLQDTEVFNFSLRQNITIANAAWANDDAALTKALDIAHVSSFIPRLPEGVDTMIGEKGVKLSGGERQRLGIARAVFKNPDILFLDEATSHLDLESEEKIRDSLHVFFQQVTAIVIAHRLTTIKEMDRILVLEKGELIESGTFDELYKLRGRFYTLWEMQKLD